MEFGPNQQITLGLVNTMIKTADKDGSGVVLPDGISTTNPGEKTREQSRKEEDGNYVPVIIKRSDETGRHPDDALENAIEEGVEQLCRPALSLFLSALAGGLIVGFSAMAVAVVLTLTLKLNAPEIAGRIASAFVYPLGFIVCILSGAQLFTEHTATALYPVLDRKAKLVQLLNLWGIVILGNLVGAFGSASLLFMAGEVIDAEAGFISIGHHLTKFSNTSLFVSAVLAGWLMATAAWLVASTSQSQARITVIFVVTFLIGLGGFHHSIAGAVEMFAAVLYDPQFTIPIASRFISVTLCGNTVGGVFFVALLNYAYIRRTND